MAAIAYPTSEASDRSRPALRLVDSPGARRPSGPSRPSAVVLRRRRLLAAAALSVVLALAAVGAGSLVRAGAGLLSGAPAGSPGSAGAPALVSADVHVVQPGETYWSIAEDLDRTDDVRGTVDALVAANGGRALRAGDRLVLPAD